MGRRPPTFRLKRRYLLARINPPWREFEAKELYSAVMEAATSLWGDRITACMQPSVVTVARGYAILRCTRGEDERLATAIATVVGANRHPVSLRTVARSGTILSLKRRMARMPLKGERLAIERGGRAMEAVRYAGQKIDLIEEGIKNQELLFFTDNELEER
ncbi:MAG: Rpp14/Pop5 family protein [Methanomicrobiales archaeon]|nr:Rpp14/Pop5 family protein [Methanomicrobiales archaeon]